MKRLLVIFTLVTLLVVPSGVALAAPAQDEATVVANGQTVNNDIAVFGKDLEVHPGAFVDGDVVVFAGNATIQGQVDGDVVVFGGDMSVSDEIDGDIVLFGGNLVLNEGADLRGDCVLLGGNLEGAEGTKASCSAAGDFEVPETFAAISQDMPEIALEFPNAEPGGNFFGDVVGALFSGLFAGLLAFVIAMALPQHMARVAGAVRQKPVASGAVGLLTAVAVPAIITLLVPISILLLFVCVGILGFPIMLALGLALVAGSVMGWMTVGHLVGEKLVSVLKWKRPSLPVTAALGAGIMTLVINLLGAVTFGIVDGLLTVIVTSVGLGAVALTQFGTKPYPFLAQPTKRVIEAEPDIVVDDDKLASVLDTLPRDDDSLFN